MALIEGLSVKINANSTQISELAQTVKGLQVNRASDSDALDALNANYLQIIQKLELLETKNPCSEKSNNVARDLSTLLHILGDKR